MSLMKSIFKSLNEQSTALSYDKEYPDALKVMNVISAIRNLNTALLLFSQSNINENELTESINPDNLNKIRNLIQKAEQYQKTLSSVDNAEYDRNVKNIQEGLHTIDLNFSKCNDVILKAWKTEIEKKNYWNMNKSVIEYKSVYKELVDATHSLYAFIGEKCDEHTKYVFAQMLKAKGLTTIFQVIPQTKCVYGQSFLYAKSLAHSETASQPQPFSDWNTFSIGQTAKYTAQKPNPAPQQPQPSAPVKEYRRWLKESKEVDAVIAFSNRMPAVGFYPNQPKHLADRPKLPYKTFCLCENSELRYYCIFYPMSIKDKIDKMQEKSPLWAATWLIRNGHSFVKGETNDIDDVHDGIKSDYHYTTPRIGSNGYDHAYPFATFYELENYDGYEDFEKEQDLGKPEHLGVDDESGLNKNNSKQGDDMSESLNESLASDSHALNNLVKRWKDKIHKAKQDFPKYAAKLNNLNNDINNGHALMYKAMCDIDKITDGIELSGVNESRTSKQDPTNKKKRWQLKEEDPAPAPAPAAIPAPDPAAAPAAPPAEGEPEPTVEQVVGEFVTQVREKFPRLEIPELEQIILNTFKALTNQQTPQDTVPTQVAEAVVKRAMVLCEEYNTKKAKPELNTKFSQMLKKSQ